MYITHITHTYMHTHHLSAGAKLEDREEVGEVVSEHVTGDRYRVLALPAACDRCLQRLLLHVCIKYI
jgi:hypothetical protein